MLLGLPPGALPLSCAGAEALGRSCCRAGRRASLRGPLLAGLQPYACPPALLQPEQPALEEARWRPLDDLLTLLERAAPEQRLAAAETADLLAAMVQAAVHLGTSDPSATAHLLAAVAVIRQRASQACQLLAARAMEQRAPGLRAFLVRWLGWLVQMGSVHALASARSPFSHHSLYIAAFLLQYMTRASEPFSVEDVREVRVRAGQH